jgi:dTDP-4-amino-4,6-dideoxygalactose transaminase
MVTTNDRELARRVRMLRNHGLDPDSPTPEFVAAGFNLRLTEFQGALGLVQLGRLQAMLATRRRIAAWYAERLSGQGLVLPAARDPEAHVYQAYVVLLPSEAAPLRAGIIDRLREAGVETTIGTHHIPLTRFYRERGGYTPGQFSVTDSVAARALTLPMHGGLDRPQVDRVADLLLAELASLDSGVRRA